MLNAAIRDIPLPASATCRARPVSESAGFLFPTLYRSSMASGISSTLTRNKIIIAYRRKICFLCGEPLGRFAAFVIGPMGSSINRVSSEPPAHRDCAEYAVRACPVPGPAQRQGAMTRRISAPPRTRPASSSNTILALT